MEEAEHVVAAATGVSLFFGLLMIVSLAAGGSTFDVREEMKSYRFTSVLIAAYRKIPRRASSVTRVGGFRACRSLRRFRLASASSSVSRVRDSDLIFGSSSLCAPVHSRSDRYRSFVRPASCLPDQMTRTSVAPTGHKLFNFISTSLQPRRWAHI